MALYVAAAVHGYHHTGYTDDFLIQIQHPLALSYNDTAIQANHSVSSAFAAMRSGLNGNPGEVMRFPCDLQILFGPETAFVNSTKIT